MIFFFQKNINKIKKYGRNKNLEKDESSIFTKNDEKIIVHENKIKNKDQNKDDDLLEYETLVKNKINSKNIEVFKFQNNKNNEISEKQLESSKKYVKAESNDLKKRKFEDSITKINLELRKSAGPSKLFETIMKG